MPGNYNTGQTTPLSVIVADNVRLLAGRRRVRQSDLARLFGVSRMAISDRFRYKTPWTVDELGVLAAAFGVPVGVLAGEVEVSWDDGSQTDPEPELPSGALPMRRRVLPRPVGPVLPGLGAFDDVG